MYSWLVEGVAGGCGVELCFLSEVVVRWSVIVGQYVERMREQHANSIQRGMDGVDYIGLGRHSDTH